MKDWKTYVIGLLMATCIYFLKELHTEFKELRIEVAEVKGKVKNNGVEAKGIKDNMIVHRYSNDTHMVVTDPEGADAKLAYYKKEGEVR